MEPTVIVMWEGAGDCQLVFDLWALAALAGA